MPLLKIQFNRSQELFDALQRRGPQIVKVLATKLQGLMYQLQAKVVREKLSGQVLHRRTGTLAGSVRALPVRIENAKMIGTVEAGDGPAFYGRFHESGARAHEIVATKARALQFMTHGKEVFAARVFHPGNYARRFMATSLQESAAQIVGELNQTLADEVKKAI